MLGIIYFYQVTLHGKIGMSQTFNDLLHSTWVDSIPKEMLGLGQKWLLDLLGVAAGAIETSMSRIVRNHVAEHFAPGQRKVPMQSPNWGMKGRLRQKRQLVNWAMERD